MSKEELSKKLLMWHYRLLGSAFFLLYLGIRRDLTDIPDVVKNFLSGTAHTAWGIALSGSVLGAIACYGMAGRSFNPFIGLRNISEILVFTKRHAYIFLFVISGIVLNELIIFAFTQ